MLREFELTAEGRAYVPVFIKPYDSHVLEHVMFKLDTGADLTTISKADLELLGYTPDWIVSNTKISEEREVASAGGNFEKARYIQIPKANFLGRDLVNWPFHIRSEAGKDYRNLLGIDVLSNFDFSFKFSEGILQIIPISNIKIVLDSYEGQWIEAIEDRSIP